MTTYIVSNRTDGAMWHIGVRNESRGARTGKLLGVSFRTRCAGRILGGAYGYSKHEALQNGAQLCPSCARLGDKDAPVAEARPVGEPPIVQAMVESWLGEDCPADVAELAKLGAWHSAALKLAKHFEDHAKALREASQEIV